jgi:hypothetical protein
MDIIRKQVLRARRLLWTQTFLRSISWFFIIAFSVCFAGMLVPKLVYLPYTFRAWGSLWMGCSAAIALLAGLLVSYLYRPTLLASAIEVDRRFALRERLSSTLQLPVSDLETKVGSALLEDAQSKAERIDVRDQFPVRLTPQSPWVMLPVLACVALFWVPDAELPQGTLLATKSSERLTNIKNQTKPILAQIKKQRESLEEKGLQEAADEFKKLEKKLEDLQKTETLDAKKLLSSFNEIKKELEQRKESLGGADNLKKAFEGMKDIDKGPADKMSEALKKGDFEKASDEVEKMLDQLKSDKLTEAQKQQLAKQMEQLQKAIEKNAEQREQAMEQAKRDLEKAKQQGDDAAAQKIQKKLDQLQSEAKKAKAAQSIKDQLAKAQQAMEKGDKAEMQKALEELQGELGDLGDEQASLEEMEELAESLQDAKRGAACGECNGEGCGECNSKKRGKDTKNGKSEGPGGGDREEKENDTKLFDSQVREQMRKGETVFGGKVGGPNRKGTTKEETRDAILSSKADDPEAIENLALPKAQRDQQRDYFNSLRNK